MSRRGEIAVCDGCTVKRCRVECVYLIVPASRGLNAYSQSFMSFSLLACSKIPLCFVHTANVLGVCQQTGNTRHAAVLSVLLMPAVIGHGGRRYLQHSLLVLTVLHLRCGEVENPPLHRVLVAVVNKDVRPTHNDKVLHPRVGAWLHEAKETLLGHNRSDNKGGKEKMKLPGILSELAQFDLLVAEIIRVQEFKSIQLNSARTRKRDYLLSFELRDSHDINEKT